MAKAWIKSHFRKIGIFGSHSFFPTIKILKKAKIKKLTATTDTPNLGNDTPFTLNESFYQKGLLEKILRTTNTITVLSLKF